MSKLTPQQQVKQLRTDTTAYGATDIEAMNNRVIALETLYHLAGRHHPDHTMHGLYTGLNQTPPDSI